MQKLNSELLKKFENQYDSDIKNNLIEGAISNVGVVEASKNKRVINKHNFLFNEEIDHKNITNQNQSGRCWMFAALNMARPKIMKDLNLDDFELSESYLYFYDNMEKTNVFLDKIIKTKDLDINSREVIDALKFKTDDGGYFEYFKILIDKYGIVPKNVMGESFNTDNAREMFLRIEEVTKKYAMDIRNENSYEEIDKLREECLSKVYNILVKCIGKPVEKFDFEYQDKDKNYHIEKNMTPMSFYKKYLDGFYDNKIRLINDPRERNPYARVFINPEIKNLVELEGLRGLNVPTEEMKNAMVKSLKDGNTAWFACDVGKMSDRKSGILDLDLYNYDDTLVPVGEFSKADRIDSRQSMATHAMNITGVKILNDKPEMWKVENSWGEKNGKKGIFSMSDAWFDSYVYELIIEKDYVDEKYLKGLDEEAIEYSPYDAFCTAFGKVR
ncbi:aminopeptidase [Peptoniphilus sp. MSJ-1]|uniref:Aminopeptidase n=1 Tax=Peptoniphilus ovalis TaxID=2841503 RepID=A0ABS6FJJ6_9FIRM|nr:C1 family peptidase [Peptoniphilus ovalis]MBU5669375.1 aminopeptidase [Peptoniphilus ovalis]